MASTAFVFHIEPGMTPKCLEFAEEATGPRRAEHDRSRRRLGISVEKVWVENTNEGDMLIFYLESDDLVKTLGNMGESTEMYDLWFREKVYTLTGVDLCDYRNVSSSELVFESPEGSAKPAASVATVMHPVPERKDEWLRLLRSLKEERAEEYRGYLERYGLTRERLYTQNVPRRMIIYYAEGQDPAGAIGRFAKSHHPFDMWMREELLHLTTSEYIRRQTAPSPHTIIDWSAATEPLAA